MMKKCLACVFVLLLLVPLAKAESVFGTPVAFEDEAANGFYGATFLVDGNIVFFGETGSMQAAYALCVNIAGDIVWRFSHSEKEYNFIQNAIPNEEGGATLHFFSYSEGEGVTLRLIDIGADGKVNWTRDLPADADSVCSAFDGGFLIDGMNWHDLPDGMQWEGYLVRTDQDGNELWRRTYPDTPYHGSFSDFLPAEGGYRCVGVEETPAGIRRAFLAELDASGELLAVHPTEGDTRTYFADVAWLPDGGLIAVGFEMIGEAMEGRCWRFDAEGNIAFKQPYGPGTVTNFYAVEAHDGAALAIGSRGTSGFAVDRIELDGKISASYAYTGSLIPQSNAIHFLKREGQVYIAFDAGSAAGGSCLCLLPLTF